MNPLPPVTITRPMSTSDSTVGEPRPPCGQWFGRVISATIDEQQGIDTRLAISAKSISLIRSWPASTATQSAPSTASQGGVGLGRTLPGGRIGTRDHRSLPVPARAEASTTGLTGVCRKSFVLFLKASPSTDIFALSGSLPRSESPFRMSR